MGADRPTLRAPLRCSATALQHLTRMLPLPAYLCLVAKHLSDAENINTTLAEYQHQKLDYRLENQPRTWCVSPVADTAKF